MIRTRGLARSFRLKGEAVEAVRGLDIEVEAGSVVALLGPNGAGKTTSLRMLTTLLAPTAGSATVAGCELRSDPGGVRRRIGYLGQGNSAGPHFQVRDELVTQGCAYGLPTQASRDRADRLLSALDLEGLAHRTVHTLSGGQRRRLDIAVALVHEPELLFLDEPTTGLDPQSRANIWGHLLRLHRELGTTVFFTTHYLHEADLWAERVLVLDEGRVIADDSPAKLKADLAGDRLTLEVAGPGEAERAARLARGLPGVHEVTVKQAELTLRTLHGDAQLPLLIREFAASGVQVRTARLAQPTLDDVFLALTGRTLRESSDTAANTTAASAEFPGARA